MIGDHSPATGPGQERECPDCGLFQTIPALPPNAEADCLRCNATLRRTRPRWENRALALSLTSLVLYLVAVTSPFLGVDIVGQQRETTMLSLPAAFTLEGAWELALIVTATAIMAPAVKILTLLFVLVGLRTAEPPKTLPLAFKYYRRIGPWAMVEVFLLGVFVAFTRLGAIATVNTGVALYAVAGLMVSMVATDFIIDSDGVWEAMQARGLVPPPPPPRAVHGRGHAISCTLCGRVNRGVPRCTQCNTALHERKPSSFTNTWALLIASFVLYIPANIYPVLTTTRLGTSTPSTILGGAQELLEAGMWPLALLVFVASIMVPLFKLISLTFMLVATHRGSSWRLQDRARLFRLVDFIGRWSMIDVFMLSTLVGLVQAGVIATILPGTGAICFGSVVVLTMLAAACFDPRLMWDAAGAEALDHRVHEAPSTSSERTADMPANAGHV